MGWPAGPLAVESLPVTTVQDAPSRASVRCWEAVLRRFPDLRRSEVAVVQAFTEFPALSSAELATRAGVAKSTVDRVLGADRFGQVLLAFMLARGDLFTATNLVILEECQRRLLRDLFTSKRLPNGDEKTMLELLLKRSGLLQPEAVAAVQVNVGAGQGPRDEILELVRQTIEPLDLGASHSPDCDGQAPTAADPSKSADPAVSTLPAFPAVEVAP